MTSVDNSTVESALGKVADKRPDLLPERNGTLLVFHPSKQKGDLTRSFFALFPREDGKYWVRCQGKGGTRPDYPGPAIAEITEEWVEMEVTNFIETTERDFGLKS